MNYKEALEYINNTQKYGSVLGLENMERLCDYFNNPQNDIRIIHIAGTNGKGSTGAFIESILRCDGKNVCRYTSPAVFDYREIWTYNGENITECEYADYITKIKKACDFFTSKGYPHPTPFEIETMLAFLYCYDKKCDYAIMETGLGGRYDAVNVIEKSEISVITSISMDHMQFLGDSIEKIAYEKAGIIKKGGRVVSAVQEYGAQKVIADTCRDLGASLTFCDTPQNVRGNVFDYDGMHDIKISLNGAYQPENAILALTVCEELKISETAIRAGLNNAVWHGRFEQICDNPVFIIDGAHNIDAVEKLKKSILGFKDAHFNFIIGVLSDKEHDKMMEIITPLADRIFTVTPNNRRAMPNTLLAREISKYNKNVVPTDIETAVYNCLEDKDRITVAFGSLSYLGEVKKAVEKG